MNKKIFHSSFFVAVIVLIASIIMIFGVLFHFFETQLQNELKNEAYYISHAVENEGNDFFKDFDSGGKRITLIKSDGSVIFDNQINAEKLDNHLNREEMKQAIKSGSGISVRYSDTFMEKTIYYAVKLSNGNILRISTNQYTIFMILLDLLQPFLFVLLIALILSLFLSSRLSKTIIEPINNIDLNHVENNVVYEELSPLLAKIAAQKCTINNQLKDAVKKQEQFKLITENMSEGFLIIDKNAMLLTYNKAALKLLEIDVVSECSVLVLNRTKNFRIVVEESLNGNHAENIMTHEEYSYNLIANPVFEDNHVIGAVIVIIDITESVKREALRREFTANVSHELKTPLTSISGFAELMKSGETPNEIVIDFSKSIYDEAQRLISLVNDIIKISELDEKKDKADMEEVDLFELSSDIISRLEPVAVKRNICLNLIGESTVLLGNEKILDEMIYNLCDNAIKYNADNGTVDVILNESSKHIKLTVRDTGIGIPQSEQERIFERFYRVDKSHSKTIGGTGLGLSIVKHAAIYHNAEIKVKSELDKGTSITVMFNK